MGRNIPAWGYGIESTEHVVVAWAEKARGSGWSNDLIWVLVRDGDGHLRIHAIQPTEQNREMLVLHGPSEAVCSQLTQEVRNAIILSKGRG